MSANDEPVLAMVIDPAVTFAELDAVVRRAGWSPRGELATAPLVAGEPEVATWTRPTAGTLTYTCNPAVWLRVLDLSTVEDPAAAVALAVQLPHRGIEAVTRLLRSGSEESLLLGVLAARVLRSPTHVGALRALTRSKHSTVARAATQALLASPPQ